MFVEGYILLWFNSLHANNAICTCIWVKLYDIVSRPNCERNGNYSVKEMVTINCYDKGHADIWPNNL